MEGESRTDEELIQSVPHLEQSVWVSRQRPLTARTGSQAGEEGGGFIVCDIMESACKQVSHLSLSEAATPIPPGGGGGE